MGKENETPLFISRKLKHFTGWHIVSKPLNCRGFNLAYLRNKNEPQPIRSAPLLPKFLLRNIPNLPISYCVHNPNYNFTYFFRKNCSTKYFSPRLKHPTIWYISKDILCFLDLNRFLLCNIVLSINFTDCEKKAKKRWSCYHNRQYRVNLTY